MIHSAEVDSNTCKYQVSWAVMEKGGVDTSHALKDNNIRYFFFFWWQNGDLWPLYHLICYIIQIRALSEAEFLV